MDVLAVDSEGRPQLLHNETTAAGHWLSIKLVGARSNRDAYGAVVSVQAGGRTQTLLCHADGSYLSSSDSRVHAGLADASSAAITVRWPDGRREVLRAVQADRILTVIEGKGVRATP